MVYPLEIFGDGEQNFGREWLETNGLGGWASSTLAGAHTRRYHGLLVVATQPPVGRMVLLSKLEETLRLAGGPVELGCNLFPGAVHPQGHRHLIGFELDPCPTFTYDLGGLTLRKRLTMVHNTHRVLITYVLSGVKGPVHMELRPFFAGRDYHHLIQANAGVEGAAHFSGGVLRYQSYAGQPSVYVAVPQSRFEAGADWYYNFIYPRESDRGLDDQEDLFTCGVLHTTLEADVPLTLVVADEDPSGWDGAAMQAKELERRQRYPWPAHISADATARRLAIAADQCLVARGQDQATILAGYHWFTDWGRDTMIALPGICLVTNRFDEARRIFAAFAQNISEGMIPNRFPDAGEVPEYNTVDATLWFFSALYKYLEYTGDYAFVEGDLWEALQEIVDWHLRGTRYGIGVDSDGLLQAGEEGTQLTWMDAKVGDWVVTPRRGKPVEINALWYNALCIAGHIAARLGQADTAEALQQRAAAVAKRFAEVFWNREKACLYDVVAGDQGDGAIRPNQILALSLPFPLLEGKRARQVLAAVDKHLFTPRGLRSLAPEDPAYRPDYGGSPFERDGAYHQGTVWGWLIGPFLTALVRLEGEAGRSRARQIVEGFGDHYLEAGLGTISEIFNAEPPHAPKGCIAQAWSVAELLRAYCEDVLQVTTASRKGAS